jgi:plasmid stabilization system protein ParE
MKRAPVFRRAARGELMEAAARYESQRPNLGIEFLEEIDRCLGLACERPESFTLVKPEIRRITARRFPYNVFFKVEGRRIVVLAVFHTSRDPAIWQGRT